MKTYEIKREELNGAEPICYGYKVVKWDNGTNQDFRYGEPGESLVGKIFKVDGDISECEWGLHFSKDPAYVFNFYEPLGYNKYFKVAAYGKVIDATDGFKSVAQCVEFVEEYDLMEYIKIIKRFDRHSSAVQGSSAVQDSSAVRGSSAVWGSSAVRGSSAVWGSSAVRGSYGLRDCTAISHGLFCYQKEGAKYVLFNKKCTKARFDEVYEKIKSFNWVPQWVNWYEIKGNKEWWAFCFPQLQEVDNDVAWSKMPPEMLDCIKSLPEFDEKVWEGITGK